MITVLSLKQPWASLVVDGKKTIELRTWNTKHRGEFFIHASLTTDKKKCKELGINPLELRNGYIIGKAKLVSVKKYLTRKELFIDKDKHFAEMYKIPCFGFILENNERIKPIPLKGRLGFFKINL